MGFTLPESDSRRFFNTVQGTRSHFFALVPGHPEAFIRNGRIPFIVASQMGSGFITPSLSQQSFELRNFHNPIRLFLWYKNNRLVAEMQTLASNSMHYQLKRFSRFSAIIDISKHASKSFDGIEKKLPGGGAPGK